MLLMRRVGSASALPDCVQLTLQAQPIERSERKRHQEVGPSIELRVDASEDGELLVLWTFERCGILDTPMRCHGLTRPYRASLPRCGVTDCENEVERRSTGDGELVPALASESGDIVPVLLKQTERQWVHCELRMAPGAQCPETVSTQSIQDCLCHDAPGGVPCAEEEDAVSLHRNEPPEPPQSRLREWDGEPDQQPTQPQRHRTPGPVRIPARPQAGRRRR